MKTILTIIITAGLMFSGMALAKGSTALEVVDQFDMSTYVKFYKVYDENNKVVCYVTFGGNSGGVSCLK